MNKDASPDGAGREADQIIIARLNARIHNQREQIKHDQHVLREVSARAYRLVSLLGVEMAQPLIMALDEAIAAKPNPDTSPTTTQHEPPVR